MEKLTKEQIEFIDSRLHNLGVEFMDIRYEMVDHIASILEETEGEFGEKWTQYFIMHRLELLKQNRIAKRTAVVRAIKFYFKTLSMPYVLILALLMAVSVYYASFYVEDGDVHFLGMCILAALLLPMMWYGRKNKKNSVMRPLVLIHTVLYTAYQLSMIASYSIESENLMTFMGRISVSCMTALMLVLAISLYKCRKHYVGKYI